MAATDFWPAYRRTAARPGRAAGADPDPARRRTASSGSGRSARGGPRRSPRSSWRSPGAGQGPWRDVRIALGSVAATPDPRRRRRRPCSRAVAADPDVGRGRRRGPRAPRSSRSTTSARRPPTGARPRAASSAACWPMPQGSRTRRAREVRRDRARRQPVRQAVDPPRRAWSAGRVHRVRDLTVDVALEGGFDGRLHATATTRPSSRPTR